ncbi:hypothetical protein O0544_02485 [Edwardsiella anguillarum]|nr:hypothetical protein [Edwardsiella anguillarum]
MQRLGASANAGISYLLDSVIDLANAAIAGKRYLHGQWPDRFHWLEHCGGAVAMLAKLGVAFPIALTFSPLIFNREFSSHGASAPIAEENSPAYLSKKHRFN